MKNQKLLFISMPTLRVSDRDPNRDDLLQKERKESFTQALARVKDDPRAKEWLEEHGNLWR